MILINIWAFSCLYMGHFVSALNGPCSCPSMGRELGLNPARYIGPCRPGTKIFRAVPCLGRAFFTVLRAGPSGPAQMYTYTCNRRAKCFVHATAPPLAPLPRLLNCGTNTSTRGDPARDPATPAWRDGQCGQKWACSNGGGRRAGAAATSSAKLTSHPGTARAPSLTA